MSALGENAGLVTALLLGLGLAASSGLNTFLPLLMLAGAAHFHLFGVQLNGSFAWLGSDTALWALGAAAFAEVVGDKVPAVDHLLDVVGTVARPAAGALAAASVVQGDPTNAAILGLIVGAPTALSFHAAKAGTRVGSSATTMGIGNPVLSLLEDVTAVILTVVSILVPWLVPLLLFVLAIVLWRIIKSVRARWPRRSMGTT
jgi:hypothetical protein